MVIEPKISTKLMNVFSIYIYPLIICLLTSFQFFFSYPQFFSFLFQYDDIHVFHENIACPWQNIVMPKTNAKTIPIHSITSVC